MNEQQLADLFSEQLDRLLAGEATTLPPEAGDVPELLEMMGPPTARTQFQAGPAAQAAFQSQLAGWFGVASGGAAMTILGLSKFWFISIVTVIVTVVTGAGFVAVIATSLLFFTGGPIAMLPTKTPTVQKTTTVTASPVVSTTVTPSGTPGAMGRPSLSFQGDELRADLLCESTYQTGGTLMNHGDGPAANVMIGWEIVKGADLVEGVRVNPANLAQLAGHGQVNFNVEVDVKDGWWQEPNGAEIKVRLFIANEDNRPGHHQTQAHVTLVKRGSQGGGLCATPTPTPTATPVITGTPAMPPITGLPPLIFINHIHLPRLCAGVYTTHSSLVNIGSGPVDDVALAWEVIEGAELVDTVAFDSTGLVQEVDDDDDAGEADPAAPTVVASSDALTTSNPLTGTVEFRPISVEQEVKLDVKVKVKDDWWRHEGETKIKIKLSVKNKVDLHPQPGYSYYSQIITIVRQDARWVNLVGFPHNFGKNKMLVNGHIVVVDDCTGLPTDWPPGSKIQVVGWLQPDGTFIAIHIIVVNINVITGNFDSGVPWPSGGSDGGSGGSGGGSGGSKGGSKGGSGGSRGGSGGSRGGSR